MIRRIMFSNRAISSLLAETLEKISTETGGVFLGYRRQDVWYVVESIDPGPRSVFRTSYFEYDQDYVNHLINKVSRIYGEQLDLIGLWHRHPGSFDQFSSTDDTTNEKYALLDDAGAISALVNIDPEFRLSVFHVMASPLKYTKVEYRIGDNHFPRELLHYVDSSTLLGSINAQAAKVPQSNSNHAAGRLNVKHDDLQQLPFSFSQALHAYLKKRTYDQTDNELVFDASTDVDTYVDRILCAIQDDTTYLSSMGIRLKLSQGKSRYIEMTEEIPDYYQNNQLPVAITYVIKHDAIMMHYNEHLYKYYSGLLRDAYIEMSTEGDLA